MMMDAATVDLVIEVVAACKIQLADLTAARLR